MPVPKAHANAKRALASCSSSQLGSTSHSPSDLTSATARGTARSPIEPACSAASVAALIAAVRCATSPGCKLEDGSGNSDGGQRPDPEAVVSGVVDETADRDCTTIWHRERGTDARFNTLLKTWSSTLSSARELTPPTPSRGRCTTSRVEEETCSSRRRTSIGPVNDARAAMGPAVC